MSGVLRGTQELLGSAAGLRRQIAGFTLAGVLQGVGLATLIPVFRALAAGDTARALLWFALGLVATLGWGAAFALTTRKGYEVGALEVGNGLLKRLADHVVRLPLGWFGGARTGQMSTLVGDAQSASLFPALVLQQITVATTTPVAVVVVVAFVDWRLALSFVVLAPVGWLAFRWIQRSQAPARAAESEALSEVASRVLEFAQAQPVLRATGRAAEGTPSLNASLRDDRRATVRNLNQGSLPMLGYATVVDLAIGLVTVVGVYLALNGSIDVPTAAAVLVLALRFTGPLWLVGPFGVGLELASTGLNSLRAAVRTPPLPEPETTEHPADSSIEFDDVRFGYTDTPVLDGFSLRCPPRSFTALVGPSGAGKTTVTRLLARFWDVDGGSLRIGGTDVRELDSATLMAQISMVFQHVYLFDTTIDENVRLARPGATDEQVRAAGRAARLDEVVARLPMGGATPVGEGGGRLSGGERQRVAIARAFLKDAPIVLLDEVTAALDAENEAAITAAIAELARDKTVIVIAHRLSTIVAADRIAVLDGGRVAELGTHDDLVDAGGLYAAFWADRAAAHRWQLGRGTP